MNRIECISPILNVSDVSRSVHFYVDNLGFENADWGDEHFTLVMNSGCGIYLCKNGQGQPGTLVWIGTEDVRRRLRTRVLTSCCSTGGDIRAIIEQISRSSSAGRCPLHEGFL